MIASCLAGKVLWHGLGADFCHPAPAGLMRRTNFDYTHMCMQGTKLPMFSSCCYGLGCLITLQNFLRTHPQNQ